MSASGMLNGRPFLSGQNCICSKRLTPSVARAPLRQPLATARAGLPSVGMMGTKAGMTQIFRDGLAIPASVIALDEGNIITQVSFRETSGDFQSISHFGS